jgi:hypothetical protein
MLQLDIHWIAVVSVFFLMEIEGGVLVTEGVFFIMIFDIFVIVVVCMEFFRRELLDVVILFRQIIFDSFFFTAFLLQMKMIRGG